MPWKHDLNPYALGPFDILRMKGVGIRWYGLAYLTGFFLAYLGLRKAALNGKVHGLNRATLENLVFGIVLGVLVGGRLGYVVQHLDQLKADWRFPFYLNQGGMAFFGGLFGVLVCFL
ncbi:MAG: prolipoprotein diacylglyceryl transferase family protein, partial [bacterium]